MNAPSEASQELAQVLVSRETGDDHSAEGLIDGCIRVINRLYRHLGLYIGARGFTTLLSRALYLARQDHRFLASVVVGSLGEDDPLPGLRQATIDHSISEIRAGVIAIPANFIELFAHFVGRDLTERLINAAWSEPPAQQN